MKSEVPMHLDKLLKERLKNIDEKSLITLYYELISSGYSVSEVLNSIYSIQRKSERGNIDLGAYPRLTSDRAPTDIAAEVASANRAQANALHFLNLSASHRAGVGRTEKPQAAGNAPSHGREADYRERLRDNLFGPGSDIHGSAGTLTSTNREVLLRPSDVEQIRPAKLARAARRIAFGALFISIASVAVIGFSLVYGAGHLQPTTTPAQSGVSGKIEAAATLRSPGGRTEAVEGKPNPEKQVVHADASRALEPSRPAELDPAALGAVQRAIGNGEPAAYPTQQQANEQDAETGRVDADRASTHAAVVSEPAVLPQAAEGIDPARTHATELGAAAAPAPANALKPDLESHDISPAVPGIAEHGIMGDRGGMPGVGQAGIARAEQPEAAHSPAPGSADAAPETRIAEIALEDPRFKTMAAHDLVTRGDAFFAAGDLASARLFYEYAAAIAVLREASATVPPQAAEAAHDTDPARTHATEPVTAATAVPAATEFLKTAPEVHDIASAGSAGATHRIEGERGGMPATGPAEIARTEQPDAASPPAHEAAAPAPVPRIAEIAPEDPRFKTMAADALVTRGDTFFAAGDLASARLFYE